MNEVYIRDEIELIDYLRVIWKRRKLIILGILLVVIASGGFSLLGPPRYEATAQIQIGRVWDKEIENPYRTVEIIGSDAYLTRVIERLKLSTTSYKLKKEEAIKAQILEGGPGLQKTPLLLEIRTRSNDPQQTVEIANAVAFLLIEEHQLRFEHRLKEYQEFERKLDHEIGSLTDEISDLERLTKKQQLSPVVNAPLVILLAAQFEQKSFQLLNLKRELRDTRISNTSAITTENTKLIAPPILPKEHISRRIKLNIALAGVLGLFVTMVLAFFLEYLEQVRIREAKFLDDHSAEK